MPLEVGGVPPHSTGADRPASRKKAMPATMNPGLQPQFWVTKLSSGAKISAPAPTPHMTSGAPCGVRASQEPHLDE